MATVALKPDVTAPASAILSSAVGTGTRPRICGTSMAAPHVAGVAALIRQAHPTWSVTDFKAAIVNTGDPGRCGRLSRAAVGPGSSSRSRRPRPGRREASGDHFAVSLNFGFTELLADYRRRRDHAEELRRLAGYVHVGAGRRGRSRTRSARHVVRLGARRRHRDMKVRLNVPAAGVAGSRLLLSPFREAAGLVTFTPAAGSNNGVTLRVPYYLVPRSLSKVDVALGSTAIQGNNASTIDTTATVTNPGGARSGRGQALRLGSRRRQRGRQRHQRRAGGGRPVPSRPATSSAQRPRCRASASSCSL